MILHGDSLDILKTLEANSVDAVVTSPPYDDLRAYAGLPFESFQLVAQELFRIAKPGGIVVWVVGDATVKGSETGTSFKQALYFKEVGFNLHDTMIYASEKPPLTHNRYEQKFEYMFIFSRGKPKTFNGIRERSKHAGIPRTRSTFRHTGAALQKMHSLKPVAETKLRGNIWWYQTGGKNYEHPAVFPEQLAGDHILSWTNPGDTVLDPFLGAGPLELWRLGMAANSSASSASLSMSRLLRRELRRRLSG